MNKLKNAAFVYLLLSMPALAVAADGGTAEMARKLRDLLANIKALMTENNTLFKTGRHATIYSFQLEPVYTVP